MWSSCSLRKARALARKRSKLSGASKPGQVDRRLVAHLVLEVGVDRLALLLVDELHERAEPLARAPASASSRPATTRRPGSPGSAGAAAAPSGCSPSPPAARRWPSPGRSTAGTPAPRAAPRAAGSGSAGRTASPPRPRAPAPTAGRPLRAPARPAIPRFRVVPRLRLGVLLDQRRFGRTTKLSRFIAATSACSRACDATRARRSVAGRRTAASAFGARVGRRTCPARRSAPAAS